VLDARFKEGKKLKVRKSVKEGNELKTKSSLWLKETPYRRKQ
jgi:hypothetical protein